MANKVGAGKRAAGVKKTTGRGTPLSPSMAREAGGAESAMLECGPPSAFGQDRAEAPLALAAALRLFDRAARELELHTDDRLKLLNMGRTKLFEALKDPGPRLDVDQTDRLGYFLAIYELGGRLVGSSSAWLKAPNSAPLFAGNPPIQRMLGGRMADLIDTLAYLKGVYGGWA
jgi:hypothetical protein